MKKVELLNITPNLVNNEIMIRINFSNIAKWVPEKLHSVNIPLEEWLKFLEECMDTFEAFSPIQHEQLQVECLKTNMNFISSDYYFPIPKTKWKRFIEGEVEKLFLQGIISLPESE